MRLIFWSREVSGILRNMQSIYALQKTLCKDKTKLKISIY
jgi:hypothetical protein